MDRSGEWWLNIFNTSHRAVIESITLSRMQLGVQKGCQAFEADNVDCYCNGNCLLQFGQRHRICGSTAISGLQILHTSSVPRWG